MNSETQDYQQKDDSELVQLCMAEDSQAWEALVARYKKRLFNIAYQFTGRMDEAEDLTQDIFLKIYNSLEKFNQDAKFQYWIIRVSKNFCIDHYRKKRKERESLVDGIDKVMNVVRSVSTPQLVMEEQEKRESIRTAIASLPPILRSCIVLRNLYGYSYQDIAKILDIPEGTVKSRINRGRIELTRKMAEGTSSD